MNKKILILLGLVAIAIANAQIDNALSITNLNIYPNPILAGDNVTISFQLYNSYDQNLNNVNLYLYSTNPMIIVKQPAQTYVPYEIGPGLFGCNYCNVFNYQIIVPKNIPSGVYTLYLEASYESSISTYPGTSTHETGISQIPIYIYVYGKPNLSVSFVPQGIIESGEVNNGELIISNVGNDEAKNIEIDLFLYNASIIGSNKFYINNIMPNMQEEIPITFYVPNNKSIVYIKLNESYQNLLNETFNTNNSIKINTFQANPILNISEISSIPSALYVGNNQTINIGIENSGSGTARNISIDILPSNQLTILSSIRNFYIAELPPGGSAQESIQIGSSKIYNNATIPIKISYYNNNLSKEFDKIVYLPVYIANSSILNITAVYSNLTPGSNYAPVTIKVKNIGNEPAEEITLSLQSMYPITPSNGNAYLSLLNPGQEENVTFYVSVDSHAGNGSYPITLYFEWKQPNANINQEFYGNENYYVIVKNSNNNSSNDNSGLLLILAIVIIAILYIGFKRSKNKKEKVKK